MKFRPRLASTFLMPLFVVACQTAIAQTKTAVQTQEFPLEVFTVPELPLSVQQAVIVKTEKGLLLRCILSNSSDDEMIGMRYTLVVDQPFETQRLILNRSEGFKVRAFSTRRLTFQAPLRSLPKRGQRLVLMVDQALATHSIWEVVKARDALNAYLSGDYSVMPSVIKVANQIDAPIRSRIIY